MTLPGPRHTLVLPIATTCWSPPRQAARVDGLAFAPKPELHITLVGNELGRELQATFAPAFLDDALATALQAQDWRFERSGELRLLRKPGTGNDAPVAASIIELIALPAMAPFQQALGRLLGRQLPVPPPHVTLYTAGQAGGIGVPTATKLRAYTVRRLSPDALAG